MKSKLIKNIKEIDELEFINQLSIKTIEDRAKPIDDNTQDPESWRYRSFDGFLGENETLKSRLTLDWQLLIEFNIKHKKKIKHTTLSKHLRKLIQQCESKRLELKYGPMAPIELNFKTPKSLIIQEQQSTATLVEQKLYITKNIFNGFQYSLFFNPDNNNAEYNKKWNIEYKIKNLINQNEITVCGNDQGGIVDYIDLLGFYEGDETNNYRINPLKLISIFNGL
ncbi:hypothetical protein CYY_000422 [Polysphondylium violaceum]|uniref:Uncharacterized protein n=1 Tax=Polysphondylium violaceum TaxID=133409 RepID=A0A8J4Q3S0_9MYCE|nr:hypothetical protein CYY_000422 [Polysphondylium violaceum]